MSNTTSFRVRRDVLNRIAELALYLGLSKTNTVEKALTALEVQIMKQAIRETQFLQKFSNEDLEHLLRIVKETELWHRYLSRKKFRELIKECRVKKKAN